MLMCLDIKTTSFQKDAKVCAAALVCKTTECAVSDLFNDGKKIAPEASALHHITNEHIKNKLSFEQSEVFTKLQSLTEEDILVVFDYPFVSAIFAQYSLHVKAGIIDLKKVAKHLLEDTERFDMQYLRYELRLLHEETLCYNPLEDVQVIVALFEYFLQMQSSEAMLEMSFQKVLLQKIPFGKYSGRYIEEIMQSDVKYLQWLLSLEDIDEDLLYSIQHYMEGDV